tara:strand:- start:787 stop:906 length:120 start_codon:yes stop_codon:yes gene_type:complete
LIDFDFMAKMMQKGYKIDLGSSPGFKGDDPDIGYIWDFI